MLLTPVLAACASLCPQGGLAGGAVAFAQACLDATCDAVVLNVAAHPDDEAARTMVMWRHAHGARTVTLYTTCGGGGQNAIGREIGPRLAAIRIRETLAAAKHSGTQVRWLGFEDFGYSKTREETVSRWGGEDEVLARFRAAVDDVNPDIVLTNHGIARGHGHHRASAWAIREVCRERGIPLFERLFEGELGIPFDPTAIDPVRGTSYAQQAHDGWREHRTQGPWTPRDPLSVKPDRWVPVNAAAKELGEDLVAALASSSAERFASFAEDHARSEHVERARVLLPVVREELRALPEADPRRARLARRAAALERIVLAGAGVQLDVGLGDAPVVRGGTATVRARLVGPALPFRVRCGDGEFVAGEAGATVEIPIAVPRTLPAGDPAARLTESVSLPVVARVAIDGLELDLHGAVSLRLGAGLRAAWPREALYVPAGEPWERVLSLEVEAFEFAKAPWPVRVRAPGGLAVEAVPEAVSLSPELPRARVLVRVRAGADAPDGRFTLQARVGDAAPARVDVQPVDAAPARALRIALVRGPDDTVLRFLEDLAVPFDDLDETALAAAPLGDYTTLLLDIRAYHHRPDLANHVQRILAFLRDGGRVLACYHKPQEWNVRDGKPLLAPFELEVGSLRVSEEDAAVELVAADHRLLRAPFAIRAADFDGWVQERGLNFAETWDPEWQPLMRMHDDGEQPLEGGLLVAEDGAGDFVFCALALYRQLRVGHAGAARLLVNLLTPRGG